MRKLIEKVGTNNEVFRVTTDDDRFYGFIREDQENGLPYIKYKSSITWVLSYTYKEEQLIQYIARTGYHEAKARMHIAGERGSKIHSACEQGLITGSVKKDDLFINKDNGKSEELTPDEFRNIIFFRNWCEEVNPIIHFTEKTVEDKDDKYNIAGTVDIGCEIDGQKWIIDLKSGGLYDEAAAQLSAYKYCLGEEWKDAKMAVLQLGSKLNKRGWRFTEQEDSFIYFLAVRQIWDRKTKQRGPFEMDLPIEIKFKVGKLDSLNLPDSENPPTSVTTILPEIEIGDKKVATVDEAIIKPKKKYKSKKK